MNQDSSVVSEYDKKYRLDDYSSTFDDVFLEISGKGSPILSKEKHKKMMDDYGSITDSSRGSPGNQYQLLSTGSFKRILSASNVAMIDNIMDDIEDIKDIDQNSISPVSSVVIKVVDDNSREDVQLVGQLISSSASVNTVTALLQTNTLPRSTMALTPVSLEQLGRSLSLPNGIQNADIVLGTCVRKELRFRDTKNPSLVTKFRSKVNSDPIGNQLCNNDQKLNSSFLNDPKYPKINMTTTTNPWKPICYNPYIDPLLNGSPWTWEERKLSQEYLAGDINHMVIDVKRQSASRTAFENYVEEKTPAIVKFKRYFRKEPPGLFGKKKPLVVNAKTIPPSKKEKIEEKKEEPVPQITRRSAFIGNQRNLLVPRVFQ
jgi:hypothetical protein